LLKWEQFDGTEKHAKPVLASWLMEMTNCNRFSLVFCAPDIVARR